MSADQRRHAQLFALVGVIGEHGKHDGHKAKPNALHAKQKTHEARKRHAEVEGEQRQPIKHSLAAGVLVLCEHIIGGEHCRLPHVIGRKQCGAGIAAGDFKGVPLNGCNENNRIAGDKIVWDKRNRACQHHRRARENQADNLHADAHLAPHQHIGDVAGAVNQKAEKHIADN